MYTRPPSVVQDQVWPVFTGWHDNCTQAACFNAGDLPLSLVPMIEQVIATSSPFSKWIHSNCTAYPCSYCYLTHAAQRLEFQTRRGAADRSCSCKGPTDQ